MKETILIDLADFVKESDQSVNQKDVKKITDYYGLGVPVLGEMYCTLRGTSISDAERKSLTYVGGSTGLFDDFFDTKNTPDAHIQELIHHPQIVKPRNDHERLFIQFYLAALEQDHSNLLKGYLYPVYDAQLLSKSQTNPNLTDEDILYITEQKGGVSILLYRCVLEGEINEIEKRLLFKLGLLAQLENDIFDVYKDFQEGIHTLATQANSMIILRSRYKSILNDIYKLIDLSDFPERNKKKFSRMVAIIATRAFVCLDQFIELEDNGIFDISTYTRDKLICDMGTFENIIKWVGFYLNWNIGTK